MATEDPAPQRMPNGAAAAALLAAGFGAFTLALLVVLAASSGAVARGLDFYAPAGPLSGKTSVAVIVWLAIWFVLDRKWRSLDVAFARVWWWTLVLFALAFLGTFPPFFEAFGH
jgi:hypothetical protein